MGEGLALKYIKNPLGIQFQIAVLVLVVVLVSIITGGLVLVREFSLRLEREMGLRAMAIGRTLAQLPELQENVGRPGGEAIIQPIAERARLATNAAYVVVIDMNLVRYSHPLREYLGKKFSGSDVWAALANHEYLSRAQGVLGPSIRAFVPIKTDHGTRQVGVVVVGILTPTPREILATIRFPLYLFALAGLFAGAVGGVFLARKIKRAMFNLEPWEIARLLEERLAIFQSIREGVVAVDGSHRITVANEEACRLIGLPAAPLGRPVQAVAPELRLGETVAQGLAVLNEECVLGNQVCLMVNRLPIRVRGKIVGAVATFRDLTEVRQMAEELTGVKKLVDALRAQGHEHRNRLHTIAGLIQLGYYDEALDFIFRATAEEENLAVFLAKRVKEAGVAGLLLGKYNRARELRVELELDPQTCLTALPPGVDAGTVVTILGNLLDNALEAAAIMPPERRTVICCVREEEGTLCLRVTDRGPGIPPELREKIFETGFSTKGSVNRGLGLALVQSHVRRLGGEIHVSSDETGTTFCVRLPARGKEDRVRGGDYHGNR